MLTDSKPNFKRNIALPGGLRADLARICDRFESANRKMTAARQTIDYDVAKEQSVEAAGDFYLAGREVADLCLLLLRYVIRHDPDAARGLLRELLKPDLDELADWIAAVENRR